ncbi:hypothetical protein ACOMHN_033466 [Nucella lapillus]
MMMMMMKVAMTLCFLASLLLGSVSAGYGSSLMIGATPFMGGFGGGYNLNPYNNFYAFPALYGGMGSISPFGISPFGFSGGLHLGGFGIGSLGGGGY